MAKYVMALDQGTTSSRCIIFDHQGNIKEIARKEFEQIFPKPGWVEHNPMEIWSSQLAVASEAMAKQGIKAEDIEGKSGVSIGAADEDGKCKVTGIEGITHISQKYEDGLCYFGPIWINLNDDGDESPIYRNDWYHLTVNSIKLPGSPTEPTIDDDDDTDPLTPPVDVTVKLKVMKWNLVEHNIDLQ